MDRRRTLDSIIARHDLNEHPFYVAWRAGTLPIDALRDYAVEYGRFIGTLEQGWRTLGEGSYADEERAHTALWDDFKSALGANPTRPRAQTEHLVGSARTLFATRAEALGALYAFEAQQPRTTESKLAGLDAHYRVSDRGKQYFRLHASDVREADYLADAIAQLSDDDFGRAAAACEALCMAAYGALDGVFPMAEAGC